MFHQLTHIYIETLKIYIPVSLWKRRVKIYMVYPLSQDLMGNWYAIKLLCIMISMNLAKTGYTRIIEWGN